MATSQKAKYYNEVFTKRLSTLLKERLNGRSVIGVTRNFTKETGMSAYIANDSPFAVLFISLFDSIDTKILFDLSDDCQSYTGPDKSKAFILESIDQFIFLLQSLQDEYAVS